MWSHPSLSRGLLRDDGTIIIASMVIAPLLGPNMALSLATTLGDTTLALRAVKIGAVGISIAFSFSVLNWIGCRYASSYQQSDR